MDTATYSPFLAERSTKPKSNKMLYGGILLALLVVGSVIGIYYGTRSTEAPATPLVNGPSVSTYTGNYLSNDQYMDLFNRFADHHSKTFKHDQDKHDRFQTFKRNVDYIRYRNTHLKSYTLDINFFADMTHEEFKAGFLGAKPTLNRSPENLAVHLLDSNVHAAAPASVDWRTSGCVTPVKNQQQCGSCWAFSTTGSMESRYCLKNNKDKVSLSEQQLVDCSGSDGNQGCSGGLMDQAFKWIISNKGLCSEAEYPYKAADGTCQTTCKVVATITGYKDVPKNNAAALVAAAAEGPVSVAIEADQPDFQFYSGGVFDSTCGTQLDHGVLVAGYGTESGKAYYLVKNSWGGSWGEQGYIKIANNDPTGAGLCGIQLSASYPIV